MPPRAAAARLGLAYERRFTGYGELGTSLRAAAEGVILWQNLIVISWRDIPAQVLVKAGRETAKVQLSHRFQEAVDRAAMRAGKSGSEAYLADWKRSDPRSCGDDIQAEADAESRRHRGAYSDDDLLRLIRQHGLGSPPVAPPSGRRGAA